MLGAGNGEGGDGDAGLWEQRHLVVLSLLLRVRRVQCQLPPGWGCNLGRGALIPGLGRGLEASRLEPISRRPSGLTRASSLKAAILLRTRKTSRASHVLVVRGKKGM